MNIVKKIVSNMGGLVLGFVGGALVCELAKWVFLSLLPQVPFIPALLSWPVDYEWYAFIGVLAADVFAGVGICKFFCDLTETKLNYGVLVLSLINAVRYIIGLIGNIANQGFSLSLLFVYIVAFGGILFAYLSCVANQKD